MKRLVLSDKIVIGATAVIGLIALWMHCETDRYMKSAKNLESQLKEIQFSLFRGEMKINSANRALNEGNEMLRKLLKR